MTLIDTYPDHNERVVQVTVIKKRKHVIRYAILDVALNYWRGKNALSEYDAWTRDTKRRAEFINRAEAERELEAIRRWRKDLASEAVTATPCERAAA